MNPVGVFVLTLVSAGAGSALCYWLLHQAREAPTSLWLIEHAVCPIIRILVLLLVVSMVYPVIDTQAGSLELWGVLSRQGQFNNLLNILFLAGLGLAFLPLVSHPVFALPIQSLLTIALVFSWQYASLGSQLELFPSLATLLKIVAYMFLAYFVTREASVHLSHWLDDKYAIEGSIRLISDAIYLVLQLPVMLIYCAYLKQQLPG